MTRANGNERARARIAGAFPNGNCRENAGESAILGRGRTRYARARASPPSNRQPVRCCGKSTRSEARQLLCGRRLGSLRLPLTEPPGERSARDLGVTKRPSRWAGPALKCGGRPTCLAPAKPLRESRCCRRRHGRAESPSATKSSVPAISGAIRCVRVATLTLERTPLRMQFFAPRRHGPNSRVRLVSSSRGDQQPHLTPCFS